jgi:hypothetical protein
LIMSIQVKAGSKMIVYHVIIIYDKAFFIIRTVHKLGHNVVGLLSAGTTPPPSPTPTVSVMVSYIGCLVQQQL